MTVLEPRDWSLYTAYKTSRMGGPKKGAIADLKTVGDAASAEMGKGVENAWAEMKKAFESATAKFK